MCFSFNQFHDGTGMGVCVRKPFFSTWSFEDLFTFTIPPQDPGFHDPPSLPAFVRNPGDTRRKGIGPGKLFYRVLRKVPDGWTATFEASLCNGHRNVMENHTSLPFNFWGNQRFVYNDFHIYSTGYKFVDVCVWKGLSHQQLHLSAESLPRANIRFLDLKNFWCFHFVFCEDVHVIWPISFGWLATARHKDPVVLHFLSHAKEAFRVLLKHNLDFYEVVHKATVWCPLKHLLVHLLWYLCIIHGGSWVEFLHWWWSEIVELYNHEIAYPFMIGHTLATCFRAFRWSLCHLMT